MLYVPVVDYNQTPLMPTTPKRAAKWIKSGKATPFWKKGVFCVRLNVPPSGRKTQPIVVGVDPGSKKEGFTVKSATKTFLNIQADAVTWVKARLEDRKNLRRGRRNRKTPYRANRQNRSRGGLPPSTRARWGWKLRLLNWLTKIFPIVVVIIEDVKAKTKCGQKNRKWNKSFSPLQAGKNWFYHQVQQIFPQLETRTGFQTKALRDTLGLTKLSNKMSENFHTHCVDSWVLANSICGQQLTPDNKNILFITPLQLHRRQLHVQNFTPGHVRKEYGSTRSLGFQRGSLTKHPKYGLNFIGGTSQGRISIHSITTGKRLCQNARPEDIKFLTHSSWRWHSSHP